MCGLVAGGLRHSRGLGLSLLVDKMLERLHRQPARLLALESGSRGRDAAASVWSSWGEAARMTEQRLEGHGWWPYLGPYMGFMIAGQFSTWLPESWALGMLVVKPAVPALLILHFARKGGYPELRAMRFRPGWLTLDILLGIALAVLWMAPYLLIDGLPRPEAEDGFNPEMAGASAVGLVFGLRLIGYALVTPLFEELFIRSFVMRVADVYNRTGDFRRIPIARYTQRSFIATVVIFTAGHMPWEWWVAVPWVVATNLWFYLRKDMGSVIAVHASTNAAILVYVYVATGGVPGGPLWIFV